MSWEDILKNKSSQLRHERAGKELLKFYKGLGKLKISTVKLIHPKRMKWKQLK